MSLFFEINTFGGSLDAAFSIVDTILSIKTVRRFALIQKKRLVLVP
jgi:membrane-bound serine protease (ClpP class)